MSLVCFELAGDMALWRNFQESMGSYSCLGPAPANLAGLVGAALGFASPHSQGNTKLVFGGKQTAEQRKKNTRLPWPISPELLKWEEEMDIHIACRWTGGTPRREQWNVNGVKDLKEGGALRMQQQVIIKPSYQVALQLPDAEASLVAEALQRPAFPLYLGASFCRAIIRNISAEKTLPTSETWAFHISGAAIGEATPFSRHRVDAEESGERLRRDGYWIYPTQEHPGPSLANPLIRAWCSGNGSDS